jgi:H+/gluconate symporter-like permease
MARPLLVLVALLTAVVGVYAGIQSVRGGSVTRDLLEFAAPAVLAFVAARMALLPPPSRWVAALPLAAALALVLWLGSPSGVFRVLVNFAGGFVIFWWLDRRGRYVAAEDDRTAN